MKEGEKLKIYFERYNSKYNRLYEQLTNIILVLLGSIVGYLAWKIPYQMKAKKILDLIIINKVTEVYFYIWIILAFSMGILSTNLVSSGIKVHKIINLLKSNKL